MNDIINIEGSPQGHDDEFVRLVRRQLHSLADQAPATVRQLDEVVVGPEGSGRRGQRRRAAGIGATIAALLGGLGITAVALNGAGSGGAGTPAEAVQLFVEALDNEDILGMIDVLDPAEVPAFRAAAEQGSAEAQRIDLLNNEFSLDGVAGVDVGVDGLTLDTEQLTDDVAVVTAGAGTVTTSFDPAMFPFGDTLREIIGPSSATSSVTKLGPDDHAMRLATVQRDGRWFVSVTYTIAEYARRGAGTDLPVGPGVAAEGFDSPEAAATALFERLAALDFEGVVATSAPGEGDAVRQYAPLWLPAAADVTSSAHEAGFQLDVSEITFETTDEGDRRTLRASTFVLDGTVPADQAGGGLTLDRTLPTSVQLESGEGWVIIPAGQPLPMTIEGLPVEPTPPQGPQSYNYTSAGLDGVIVQLPVRNIDDPDAPLAVHIERADGCTTWSGLGAVAIITPAVPFGRLAGYEQLGDGTFRSCDSSSLGVSSFLFLGEAGPAELPDVATVLVDGKWYVSPVGTAVASIVDVLRDVPDSGSLFDSTIAQYVYGTSRGVLEMIYVGQPDVSVTPECLPLFEFDAAGIVTAVVDDPKPADIAACNGSSLYGTDVVAEGSGPATSLAGP